MALKANAIRWGVPLSLLVAGSAVWLAFGLDGDETPVARDTTRSPDSPESPVARQGPAQADRDPFRHTPPREESEPRPTVVTSGAPDELPVAPPAASPAKPPPGVGGTELRKPEPDPPEAAADEASAPPQRAEERDRESGDVWIGAGEFPLKALLRFLSEYSGRPVLVDSGDTALLERSIVIVAPIHRANVEMLRAILENNRIRILHEQLRDGRKIIRVASMAASPAIEDPRPRPIIIAR